MPFRYQNKPETTRFSDMAKLVEQFQWFVIYVGLQQLAGMNMPWTETARIEYRRKSKRYSSDMTEREWAVIEPFMPPANRQGRPRTTNLREVFNAVLYMATTGCQWVQIPKDFPPYSTVQRNFYDWRDSGLWQTMRFNLAMGRAGTGRLWGHPHSRCHR
jgi:transposase